MLVSRTGPAHYEIAHLTDADKELLRRFIERFGAAWVFPYAREKAAQHLLGAQATTGQVAAQVATWTTADDTEPKQSVSVTS